jgi:hypothetical protein
VGFLSRIRDARARWLAFYERRTHRDRGALRVVDGVLEIRGPKTEWEPFRREDVDIVEFFKRDMLTVDDICCDLFTIDGRSCRFDEEMPGWAEAVDWLEGLPGFYRDWRRAVVLPPMFECRTRVYVRGSPIY